MSQTRRPGGRTTACAGRSTGGTALAGFVHALLQSHAAERYVQADCRGRHIFNPSGIGPAAASRDIGCSCRWHHDTLEMPTGIVIRKVSQT